MGGLLYNRVMREKSEAIRQQIIESADQLFYRRGYNLSSFTDLADFSNIPRGNIYYYFKTKDALLSAVIDHRITQMQHMLSSWEDDYPDVKKRLQRFVQILSYTQHETSQFGCPMGSLFTELGKAQPELAESAATPFSLFEKWLNKQFKLAGKKKKKAKQLSLDLLAKMQGASVISQLTKREDFIEHSVEDIFNWLDTVLND